MFESKNLLFQAQQNVIYDRLCSAVYYALNYTVGFLSDPDNPEDEEHLLNEWRDLGPYTVCSIVVLSKLEEGPSLPHSARLIPWIVRYFQPYREEAVLPIVEKWLDGEPLADHVSRKPEIEDLKVKQLERLIAAVHAAEKLSAGKVILRASGESSMMRKGYVSHEARRAKPEGNIMDYWFTDNPESALFWQTKEEAEIACTIFNNNAIMINSAEGGKYHCSNFRTEKRRSNEFVVFCEAPFIPRHSTGTPGQGLDRWI